MRKLELIRQNGDIFMAKKTVTSRRSKTIEDQIKKLTEQAMKRRVYEKAQHVAYYLGEGPVYPCDPNTRRTYRNLDTKLTIKLICRNIDRSTYETLEILVGEKTVFLWKKKSFFEYRGREVSLQQDQALEGYIPGDWETELDMLKKLANRAEKKSYEIWKKKDQVLEQKKRIDVCKPWGLSE